MIRKIFYILSILSAILFTSCTDYNEIDDQRTYIVDYLDDLDVEYDILGNVFRYFDDTTTDQDSTEESESEAEYITKGSKFYIYFIGYTFTSYPASVFFTNIESVAQANFENVDSTYWSFEPLEIVLGETELIKGLETGLEGCQYGDIVYIFMTYEQAYGEKGIGVVPENTAVMYAVQILE